MGAFEHWACHSAAVWAHNPEPSRTVSRKIARSCAGYGSARDFAAGLVEPVKWSKSDLGIKTKKKHRKMARRQSPCK